MLFYFEPYFCECVFVKCIDSQNYCNLTVGVCFMLVHHTFNIKNYMKLKRFITASFHIRTLHRAPSRMVLSLDFFSGRAGSMCMYVCKYVLWYCFKKYFYSPFAFHIFMWYEMKPKIWCSMVTVLWPFLSALVFLNDLHVSRWSFIY